MKTFVTALVAAVLVSGAAYAAENAAPAANANAKEIEAQCKKEHKAAAEFKKCVEEKSKAAATGGAN